MDISSIQILYEDNHLIAVNKPAGWLVQGDITGDVPLSEYMKEWIKIRYKKPGDVFLGVIHRIDRPVSGVVVFARTSKGLVRMNNLFQKGEVKKTYWAITAERPNPLEGELSHFLVKDHKKNRVRLYDFKPKRQPKAKKADLSYKLIASIGKSHLIEVNLKTGRPHQIRAQLGSIGCPIKGDKKYGFHNHNKDGSILLHAREIRFIHPVKKEEVVITADLPESQLWKQFEDMG